MESVNSLRISALAPPWWPLREGRDGKCEWRNEKCEFLARESVSSSPIVRIFGKGKCKFIANFSATMVTSLPSLSLSLCLYLSLSPKVPHAQYRTLQDLIICLWFSITRRAARTIWKRGNKAWGRKTFWQWKVWTHCEFQRHHGDLSAKGDGKCEWRNEKCEFLARESVSSSPILARQWWRHFRLSLSVCISLSLSLSPKVPHAQYRKRFRASYNKTVMFDRVFALGRVRIPAPASDMSCTTGPRNRWWLFVDQIVDHWDHRNHAAPQRKPNPASQKSHLRGAWRDRDTNDIFAHCSLIFYFLDFKFSNFVCPSVVHRLISFFLKNSFRKKKNIRKTTQNALAPGIFIVFTIALKLGTPLLHTQAQNIVLQNF